jgi:site-specific DNA-methyltransferase (adenine-specific)
MNIIEIFTDKDDVIIDPCAWSWTTLLAGLKCNRKPYWFEIKKNFIADAEKYILSSIETKLF